MTDAREASGPPRPLTSAPSNASACLRAAAELDAAAAAVVAAADACVTLERAADKTQEKRQAAWYSLRDAVGTWRAAVARLAECERAK